MDNPYTPLDYYSVLKQLHPQPMLGGDFSSNMGVIAQPLQDYDSTVQQLMSAVNPEAFSVQMDASQAPFLDAYVADWVPYMTPADVGDYTYETGYLARSMSAYANRGSKNMLPYNTIRASDTDGTYWNWVSLVGSDPASIFGWVVRLFENTTAFMYSGYEPNNYASPLDGSHNKVYEIENQWHINCELIQGASHISEDAVKQYILERMPAWVRVDFYNNTSTDVYPGSAFFGGSGTAHWSIPGSGAPYSAYYSS